MGEHVVGQQVRHNERLRKDDGSANGEQRMSWKVGELNYSK